MSGACEFSVFGAGFDVGACINSVIFGWVPDWVWSTLGFIHDYWSWIAIGFIVLAVLGALYRVYLIFGMPGVIAAFGAAAFILGFVLGKRSVVRVTPHPTTGQPTVKFPGTVPPVVVKKPQHVTTIFDTLRSLTQP